jgi:pumilio family protein 6
MVAAKNNKKRSETTKLESERKRRSTEKKELPVKPSEKKRSRPITHTFPIVEESDSDVKEGESSDMEDADDDNVNGVEPVVDEEAMDVDKEEKEGRQVSRDPNGTFCPLISRLFNNQYTKPPESHTKPKRHCWNNERQQNPTRHYWARRSLYGRLHARKIFPVQNAKNMSRIS